MNRKAILIVAALWLLAIGSGLARPFEEQAPTPKSEYLRTMEAMIQITGAVKNYSIDFGYAPKVATAQELKKLLDRFYIKTLPQDAWGHDFFYKFNEKDSSQYWLASAGSDGVFKGFDQRGTWTALDGQDIILTNTPPSWVYAPTLKDWPVPDIGAPSGPGPMVNEQFFTRQNPGTTPAIVRHPAPFVWGGERGDRGVLQSFPVVKPGQTNPWEFDFRGYDLSKLDITSRLPDLLKSSFDDHTVWPPRLPEGFDPVRIMEIGRNSGLGIRQLHKRGITGKGVGVAIIDMGFLAEHVEYKDRVRMFEEIHSADETAQIHGVACSSIAVGKTVGVAPEADLYYIASFPASGDGSAPNQGRDFTWEAQCIDRILEVNRALPKDRKIRVISMSIGWGPKETGYAEVTAAVERAKLAGVFVICTSMEKSYGFTLFGLGRDPFKDPERFESFGEAWWGGLYPHESPGGREALLFPMDSRTTASPTGADKYVFYRLGGLSWSVPWAAGLYALACQVKPGVTPELFWKTALETGDVVPLPAKWPNPTAEEVDARVRKTLDTRMAAIKDRSQGKDVEIVMAEIFNQRTGQKRERMSEAEFRTWGEGYVRPEVLRETKPRELKKIVNPARLLASLGAAKG